LHTFKTRVDSERRGHGVPINLAAGFRQAQGKGIGPLTDGSLSEIMLFDLED